AGIALARRDPAGFVPAVERDPDRGLFSGHSRSPARVFAARPHDAARREGGGQRPRSVRPETADTRDAPPRQLAEAYLVRFSGPALGRSGSAGGVWPATVCRGAGSKDARNGPFYLRGAFGR